MPGEVSEADRSEWIAERIALIIDGCGYDAFKAERLAKEQWEAVFGDPQRGLF